MYDCLRSSNYSYFYLTKKHTMKKAEFLLALDFLYLVKKDIQFDKTSPYYLGFLNCGADITTQNLKK